MKLLFIVLNSSEKLEEVLEGLIETGVTGATVLAALLDEIPPRGMSSCVYGPYALRATLALRRGRLDETAAHLVDADALASVASEYQRHGISQLLHAELLLEQGMPAEASDEIERGLAGLTASHDHIVRPELCATGIRALADMQQAVDTRRLIESAGLPVTIVSGVGTGTHAISGEIKGIGVTGQMHGMVLLANGSPVSPFIGWQDRRCQEMLPGRDVNYIDRMMQLAGVGGFAGTGCPPAKGVVERQSNCACTMFCTWGSCVSR